MASNRMLKDPDEIRPIAISWRGTLPKGDSVILSTWEVVPSGELTTSNPTLGALATAVLTNAGVVGSSYAVTNRITSQAGLTLEKTVTVRVQNR